MKEKIKEQIQKLFPNEEIIIENDGWASYAFTVGDKIVRVPKKYIESYQKEEKILDFIRNDISVEIPKVKFVVKDNISYAIHKKIEGENWNIHTYEKLNSEGQDLFCYDVANFFAELHKIPVENVAGILKEFDYERSLTQEQIHRYLKDDFSKEEREKIYNLLKEVESLKDDLVFTHQDFHDHNIVVDKNHRLKGVFDFGNCGIDDRCLDFHSLYNPVYLEFLKKVIDYYEKITDIKVDIEKIRKLKEVGCIYALGYLGEYPDLKKNMKDQWNKNIDKLRNLIKER